VSEEQALAYSRPVVGVAVAVRSRGRVLMSYRRGSHSPNVWAFAGGHMEGGETFEQTGIRELTEETGIILTAAKFWTMQNCLYPDEGKHVVSIILVADLPRGQSCENLEPDKAECWRWFRWDKLPQPLMQPIQLALEAGLNPMEI
jgi:8-oxo-dGTP diphosphatase